MALRGSALVRGGVALYNQGNMAAARATYEQALSAFRAVGDQAGIAVTLNNIAGILSYQGDHSGAKNHIEESLIISRNTGNQYGMGLALYSVADELRVVGELDKANAIFRDCLAIAHEIRQE
jgi:tetratricopeptide (TPR) repeat protein